MDARQDMQPSLTFSQVRYQGRVSFAHSYCRLAALRVTPSLCGTSSPGPVRSLMCHGGTGSHWQDEHGPPTLGEVRTFLSVISLPLTHFRE